MNGENNEQNKINEELQSAIAKELDSFINEKSGAEAPKPETPITPISAAPAIPMREAPKAPTNKPGESKQEGPISINFPENQNFQKPPVRPVVRTYKSDVEETVQAGHISSVNIAIAQNERARKKVAELGGEKAEKSKMGRNILILVVVLIFGGVGAFLVPYLLVQQEAKPPVKVETVPSGAIITVDVEEKINLRNINLGRFATTLKERVDQSAVTLGQIKNIYFTEGEGASEKLITASRFLSLLKVNAPSDILRTLKDDFIFGMYNYNGIQRILLLRVGSYDITFAGMLQWEVNLWQDFKEVFGLVSEDGSTSSPSVGIEVKKFEDASFYNKDARVVKDSSGKIIFLYSIIDNNTVLITTSVDALREIINRTGKARVTTQ